MIQNNGDKHKGKCFFRYVAYPGTQIDTEIPPKCTCSVGLPEWVQKEIDSVYYPKNSPGKRKKIHGRL